MASVTGGRFVFAPPAGFSQVVLGVNNGTAPVFPEPVAGAFNIEVFTNATVSGAPPAGFPFDASAGDPNGTITSDGFLTGTSLTLQAGDYLIVDSVTGQAGQSGALIALGYGNQTVIGAPSDTLVGGNGTAQILSALLGNETVIGGTGNESIWGGSNDSIVAGSGADNQIVVTGSGTTVVAGATGNATISTAASNTVTALDGNQNVVIAAGVDNLVNLTGNTGVSAVIGSVGDTIIAGGTPDGGGTFNIDGSAGGMGIKAGSGGITNISGADSGAVDGDTIIGSSGNFTYNPGASAGPGTLFQLSGSTGDAIINAFSFGGNDIDSPDTVFAGNGFDSVFAGAGDRVGTGNGSVVGGTHLWDDSDADTVSVGFGSNDTVSSTTYNVQAQSFARGTVAGTSTANVSVTNFDTTNDFIFYQNQNLQTTAKIVATSQSATVDGAASTIIMLPDGTQMTLVGVTSVTVGMFKA